MPIHRESSLIDVAYAVCTALDAAGTTAVLTGGSAATFYTPTAYQSRDADFVITMRGNSAHASRQWGGMYAHPDNQFTVEFPNGPLRIGAELNRLTRYRPSRWRSVAPPDAD